MERRLQKISLLISALFLMSAAVFAQQPSQKEKIRIQIWSELDAFPGKFDENPNNADLSNDSAEKKVDNDENGSASSERSRELEIFGFAINRAKEISPYLLGGMLSGWEFEYVPYDKTRVVPEYFELTEIEPFNPQVNKIYYKDPIPVEDRLVCWVECDRTEVQKLSFLRWNSILHPRIKGHGTAPVEDGFDGIKNACSAAAKNAVREYWRGIVKNKPKEIFGKLLLIQNPRIYIYEGQYVVDLDFFLESDKITSYSYY